MELRGYVEINPPKVRFEIIRQLDSMSAGGSFRQKALPMQFLSNSGEMPKPEDFPMMRLQKSNLLLGRLSSEWKGYREILTSKDYLDDGRSPDGFAGTDYLRNSYEMELWSCSEYEGYLSYHIQSFWLVDITGSHADSDSEHNEWAFKYLKHSKGVDIQNKLENAVHKYEPPKTLKDVLEV
tara:strand:+ start:4220 stop:4762 length:543 start_codon:yes stop_codon:yes gene_type:complete